MLEYRDPIDQVFHALSDPARRAIVEQLSQGPASVSALAAPFEMTLAAVVQHVQVLEHSGVVTSEKLGRVRTCRLAPEGLALAERWIAERRSLWERRLDRLGDFLAAEDVAVAEAEAQSTPAKQSARRAQAATSDPERQRAPKRKGKATKR